MPVSQTTLERTSQNWNYNLKTLIHFMNKNYDILYIVDIIIGEWERQTDKNGKDWHGTKIQDNN